MNHGRIIRCRRIQKTAGKDLKEIINGGFFFCIKNFQIIY